MQLYRPPVQPQLSRRLHIRARLPVHQRRVVVQHFRRRQFPPLIPRMEIVPRPTQRPVRLPDQNIAYALFQFPVVPRPAIALRQIRAHPIEHHRIGRLRLVPHRPPRHIQQQIVKRRRHVVDLLRQRRRANQVRAQPVIQVFPKPSRPNLRRQVPVRRRDQFPLKPLRRRVPHRRILPRLHHPQQFHLYRHLHLSQLIQEHRSLPRTRLQPTHPISNRPRKRPPLVPEQLALNQRRRQRRQIHREKRLSFWLLKSHPRRRKRQVPRPGNRPRHQLFSRSRRPRNQCRKISHLLPEHPPVSPQITGKNGFPNTCPQPRRWPRRTNNMIENPVKRPRQLPAARKKVFHRQRRLIPLARYLKKVRPIRGELSIKRPVRRRMRKLLVVALVQQRMHALFIQRKIPVRANQPLANRRQHRLQLLLNPPNVRTHPVRVRNRNAPDRVARHELRPQRRPLHRLALG